MSTSNFGIDLLEFNPVYLFPPLSDQIEFCSLMDLTLVQYISITKKKEKIKNSQRNEREDNKAKFVLATKLISRLRVSTVSFTALHRIYLLTVCVLDYVYTRKESKRKRGKGERGRER